MNMLQLKSRPDGPRTSGGPGSKFEIRHLVFDMCAAHDLSANGVFHVARQLVAEQNAAGERAKIVFLREEGRDVPIEGPIQVLLLKGRKLRGRRLNIDVSVLDEITAPADRPLFFHIHAARQPLLWPVILRLRKLSIPYAMTIHGRYSHLGDPSNRSHHRLSALYLQYVERHVLEGARFVQGVSTAECELISRIAPRARVVLVPNAAYSSRFEGRPPWPQRVAPSPSRPVFGFLGRYEIEHKGLDLLLEAFATYRREGGTGTLELVGTGPARETISARARQLELERFVIVDGPRFGVQKTQTLASWDYFIMPSRFEGMPIGGLEAGLAGLPLIVSGETGLREHVTSFGAGIGIDRLEPAAIACALFKAQGCGVNEWSAMSQRAHAMALAIGDWTNVAAELASLYRGS
jgi:glycosyltransferase involved in cell wall biosynthesis